MGSRIKELKKKIRPWAEQGMRVLLAASYEGEPDTGGLTEDQIHPMALILITNRLRNEAAETFRYFREQGVSIRVISGDNPETVSRVAIQAGIEGADQFVDASTLKSDSSLEAAAEKYKVFGRVTPEQKCRLIRAMQKNGHTVAMTGDGVNDVLALKEADCGIAMASRQPGRLSDRPACAAEFRFPVHAGNRRGRTKSHKQYPAGRFPVPGKKYFLPAALPGQSVCGLPLSPSAPAAVPYRLPDHRDPVFLPCTGAQ